MSLLCGPRPRLRSRIAERVRPESRAMTTAIPLEAPMVSRRPLTPPSTGTRRTRSVRAHSSSETKAPQTLSPSPGLRSRSVMVRATDPVGPTTKVGWVNLPSSRALTRRRRARHRHTTSATTPTHSATRKYPPGTGISIRCSSRQIPANSATVAPTTRRYSPAPCPRICSRYVLAPASRRDQLPIMTQPSTMLCSVLARTEALCGSALQSRLRTWTPPMTIAMIARSPARRWRRKTAPVPLTPMPGIGRGVDG